MSRGAKTVWAMGATVIVMMGAVAYLSDGVGGLNGYALGVVFTAQWAWLLRGVK